MMHTGGAEQEISRHKCLIYDGDPAEQLPVVVPLLMDGLSDNWRCLYLGKPETLSMIDVALTARGIDTSKETKRGALILSCDRSHLGADGAFEPRAMVDGLRDSIDGAVRDGFEGLCATGDMRWELGDDENFDHLMEYEALLEQVFHEKPLRGICQYHRDILPARAIRDALLTHRTTYLGSDLNQDNLFYIPPELLLDVRSDDATSQQGEWMCRQIVRVLKAERARDEVVAALRKSEAEQRRLAEELAEANRALERRVAARTAELEAANHELEAFSYSVSHDLRAPLRSIDGYSAALEEDCAALLDAAGRDYLARIRAARARMNALIDDMLGLAKVSRGHLRTELLDVTDLARSVTDELSRQSPGRRVEIAIAPGLSARGDRSLLRAVLENLLGNAFKFTARADHPRIEVGRIDQGGERVFFVRDNGAGFDMAHAEKLFAPFQRLHTTDEFPGTGVGLATVQRIVHRHGGRIWAESSPGAGATFSFTLPGAIG